MTGILWDYLSVSALAALWKISFGAWFSYMKWVYYIAFCSIFMVSSFGRPLNIRKRYIQVLLKIFEFGNRKYQEKHSLADPNDSFDQSPEVSLNSAAAQNETSDAVDGFKLEHALPLVRSGMEAILDDSVTSSFVSESLPYWNFLSRNNSRDYQKGGVRVLVFWIMGFIIRYVFLLPARLAMLFVWAIVFLVCTSVIGCLPEGPLKRDLNAKAVITCFDFVGGCLSLAATFHNIENRPRNSVAVANHTSPIDSMVLATDNCYDMVGQIHQGVLGYFMNLLGRSSYHIWFERSASRDRAQVLAKMIEHVQDESLPPILIFPEGVCVNNTAVMQFKKGAFELEKEIHPIAIKFDPRFGDAFWWQDTFFPYILSMMTSWAIVCDVWYLPPMKRLPEESSIQFAARVKAKIAEKAGLQDVQWDGVLKSRPVGLKYKEEQQKCLAERVLSRNECNIRQRDAVKQASES